MKLSRSSNPLAVLVAVALVSTSLSSLAAGQAHPPQNIDDAIGALDPREVPTGILYDRVVPLSAIEAHSGLADSPPVSLVQWRQMYYEMRRAALEKLRGPDLAALRAIGRESGREGVIPLALMNYEYERIRPGAMEDGALVIRDGHLELGEGSPFLAQRVFAAAALWEHTYRGREVVFRLDRDLYLTNDGVAPAGIEIDFDDGLGWRPVAFGEAVTVSYGTAGLKSPRVRLTQADGNVLFSRFQIEVKALAAPAPDDTLDVTASIPYQGGVASGEAYVYLSDLNTSLAQPVVVIEGFDLDDTLNWDEIYELLNQEGLAESLRTMGYDLVVLNFDVATDYLQRNSLLVVELLEQVQALLGTQTRVILVGASMGGLCSRYALAYMETNALEHWVDIFVSFDSPQKGANIPLGLQYWVSFFAGQSADADFFFDRLQTPGARQMLAYHLTDPAGTTGEADSLRGEFLSDLATLGDYPSEPRLLAIANGSGSQADQGYAAGAQLIDYEYNSFLVDIVGNVWAVPDSSSGMIFDGLIDPIIGSTEQLSVTVSGTLPYDNAPGGSRPSMAQLDTATAPYGDIVAVHPSHCFIPTISALALDTDDLFYDVAGDPSLLSHTPFEAVYFPAENQPHITITPEIAAWIYDNVFGPVTPVLPGGSGDVPASVTLHQNVPNPFNPATTIRFELPRPARVTLTIHDAGGRKVVTLVDRTMKAGRQKAIWTGRDSDGRRVASGVYFYRLEVEDEVRTRKMVLIK